MKKIYVLEVVYYPTSTVLYAFSSREKADVFKSNVSNPSDSVYVNDYKIYNVSDNTDVFDYCFYQLGITRVDRTKEEK